MKRSTRDPRYLAVLALAAGVVLVLGNWLRPEAGNEEGSSNAIAGESALLQLPRLTQRRSIEDRVEFVTQLVARLNSYVFRLGQSQGSAVLWNAGTLVAARTVGRTPSKDAAVGPGGIGLEVSTQTAGPHLPLVLMEARLEQPPLPIQRIAAASYPEGSWVLALWRGADNELAWAEGQYLRRGRENCGDLMPAQILSSTIGLTPRMAGAGVFSVDGNLIGVVGKCDEGLAILGTQAVELLFGRTGELADRLLYRYGIRVDVPSDEERAALRAPDGLIVRETWVGYQGYASGLRPGDVIASVDGSQLSAVSELERLVLPVAQEIFDLRIFSHGRPRNVSLRARPEVAPTFVAGGIALTTEEHGVEIAQVAPDTPFAGLKAHTGDRLLALDGRVFDGRAAASAYLERASGPVWATLQRDDRLWGALLFNE